MKAHISVTVDFDLDIPTEELVEENLTLEEYVDRQLNQSVDAVLKSSSRYGFSEPKISEAV